MNARKSDERGSFTLFFAVFVLFFVSMSLLLADGATRLSNVSRAEDVASEAARAAAATLDVGSLASGAPTLAASDEVEAQAARVVAASGNATLVRVAVSPSGQSVEVIVEVPGTSILPGFDTTGRGRHVAQVIDPFAVPDAPTIP